MESIGLVQAIILSFVGGILLNLMPCVFPILSLKIIALTKRTEYDKNHPICFKSLAYPLGVACSMLLLSGALLILRHLGHAVGWGYQMQSPLIIITLIYIMFLLGLSFSGFYNVTLLLSDFSGKYTNKKGLIGNFITGVLATLIATPCSAPFMTSAIAFASTQPSLYALIIFQFLGLGISFPYIILAFYPKLLHFLPKPGKWMEVLKELLSFPMYLSVIWLLLILVRQLGDSALIPILTGLLAATFSIWFWRLIAVRSKFRYVYTLSCVVFAILPIVISDTTRNAIFPVYSAKIITPIEEFSEVRLAELLKDGYNVLVAVGADWCITCKVNEHTLSSASVLSALKKRNTIYLKADWTKRNTEISKYLQSFGRSDIPFYVLYKHNMVKILPQIFSEKTILEEINGF